jgi:flagellin-specific chaperone FliS
MILFFLYFKSFRTQLEALYERTNNQLKKVRESNSQNLSLVEDEVKQLSNALDSERCFV